MKTYGKCKYRNMENGFECGCLRFRVRSDADYSCACEHDLCYHENLPQTLSKNLINDKLNGRNIRKSNRHKKLITFKLICLFGRKSNQKIPRRKFVNNLKEVIFTDNSNNGIKNVVEAAFPHLKNTCWRFFRRASISDLVIADEPSIGWTVDMLKTSIACSRRKLYVGIVDEPIQMIPSLIDQMNSTTDIFVDLFQSNFVSENQLEKDEFMEFVNW